MSMSLKIRPWQQRTPCEADSLGGEQGPIHPDPQPDWSRAKEPSRRSRRVPVYISPDFQMPLKRVRSTFTQVKQ